MKGRLLGVSVKGFFLIVLSILTEGCVDSPQQSFPTATVDPVVKELNEHFTVEGRPVHPALIEAFEVWASDPGPATIVAVDVLASIKNENQFYYEKVKVHEDGMVFIDKEDRAWFGYEWLGTVRPGLHVVKTFASGGGSGVFMFLKIFRVSTGSGKDCNGQPYAQILLSLERDCLLGDRDLAKISVEPGRVIIGTSIYRDKPFILQFK